jgi:rubrerythrin
MDAEEILKKALKMEKEAIEVYTKMKEDADAKTADLLDFLIEEERKHVKMIEEKLKIIKLLKKD